MSAGGNAEEEPCRVACSKGVPPALRSLRSAIWVHDLMSLLQQLALV